MNVCFIFQERSSGCFNGGLFKRDTHTCDCKGTGYEGVRCEDGNYNQYETNLCRLIEVHYISNSYNNIR